MGYSRLGHHFLPAQIRCDAKPRGWSQGTGSGEQRLQSTRCPRCRSLWSARGTLWGGSRAYSRYSVPSCPQKLSLAVAPDAQLPENWYESLAQREGLFAATPLIPRLTLGTAGARARRRPSPPRPRRLVEPDCLCSRVRIPSRQHELDSDSCVEAAQNIGGERGIRTLEGLLTLTPLAGPMLNPPLSMPFWQSGNL
jgi:hypothetical protein